MLKRLPILALTVGIAAWLHILYLLPVLLGLYVVTAAFEAWNAIRHTRRRLDVLLNPDQYLPGNRPHRRPPWAFTAWLSGLWRRYVGDPAWRLVDRRLYDERTMYVGRHHISRIERHEIHGATAQRRPSAAAQQHAVAAGWAMHTDELPEITDETLHRWMAAAVADMV